MKHLKDFINLKESFHPSSNLLFAFCLSRPFLFQMMLILDFLSKISSVSGFPSSRGSLGFAEQRRNGVTQWTQWIFSICFSYPLALFFNVETRGTFGCLQNYNGTPKSSILIGFSIINHPFWGTPSFFKHPFPPVKKEGQKKHVQVGYTPPPKFDMELFRQNDSLHFFSEIPLPMDSFLAAMINCGGKCLTLICLFAQLNGGTCGYCWLQACITLGRKKKSREIFRNHERNYP